MLGPSWQPKILAILAVAISVLSAVSAMVDSDPKTTPDWTMVTANLVTAAALFRTRQVNVSSEGQGIR